MKNRGAIELSMTTIVVVVLAMSMLILGMVLVRNIMCGAMGLTTDINTKVTSQINKMFTEGSEIDVHCVGEGSDLPMMPVDQTSFIICTVRSEEPGPYTFDGTVRLQNRQTLDDIPNSIAIGRLGNDGVFEVPASTERSLKVMQIAIPSGTQPGLISIPLTVINPSGETNTLQLNFKAGSISGLQNTMC